MTEQEKKKTANLEDMQAFGRVIHNKGIGSEGICSTAAGTAAKTVTVGTTFSPVAGATLIVLFQNGISVASPTLAVTYTDGSGTQQTLAAKPIYYRGAAIAADMVKEGAKIILRYDGTNFNIVGDLDQSHLSVPLSQKGSAGGVASLDENGMVPSEQLPSYVDDVVELLAVTDTAPEHCAKGDLYFNTTTKKVVRATATDTWGTGSTTNTDPEKGKIYVDLTDDKTYRWGGTAMVPISNPTIPKTDGITGSTVNRYSECSTAAGTAAKTASITAGTFSLEKGARVTVAFANENTADNPTLNINNTGAKSIYIQGEQVTTDDSKGLLKGTCDFVYNGSAWDMVAGAGGGGGESVFGKIRVSLTALVNGVAGSASLLNGVTVTLMNTTDNVQVGVQTWAGEQIVFQKLTPQKNYSVTVSAKTGFKTPAVQTVTNLGIGEEVSKTFQYEALEYTVEMTSNQDTQQTQDADLDRTASGVYLTAQYTYGGETVAFGSQLHNGDTVLIPSDTDISTLSITASSSPSGYSKEASVDNTNKKLSVAYSTTKVFMTVTASQGDVVTGNTFKINGTNITPNDNTSFVKVPTGDSITVTAPDVSGYGKVITGGGTATGTSQTVTATYTYGVLRLTVAMSDASAADLANVAPQISVNSGAAVAMTGSGGVFEVNLDVNDTYEITFNSLVAAGYQTPSSISGTFGGGLEEKSATYQTTILTLGSIQTTKNGSVQGSNPQGVGVKVEYTGQSAAVTLSAVNDTVKVPGNLTPTLTPSTVYGYQASASESSGSITLTYATVAYALTVQTNQSAHTDIAQTVIRVSGTGISANGYLDFTGAQNATEVLVPANVTPTAACQSGQPNTAEYRQTISVDSTNHAITAQYDTEVLTVSITKDSGDGDLSTCSIAVTDGQTSLGTLTSASPTMKIAYGINYTLTPSSLEGYNAPAAVTKDWSDAATKSVTFGYEEVTLITGYIILDQTSSDPTTKVLDEAGHTYSNYQRPAVIDAIRAASHCYVGTFANNKMTLKQLDDTDGTKYADGTSAASDIASTSKDVFMRLPFFFTRVSTYATDKIKIEFAFDPNQTVTTTAQPDGSGWKQWGGNDLIGKYEAYEANSKTYSISGQTPTGNVSQADFKSHARSKGTGFTIVKWRHQNIMAILFYAYYGHTNCQSLIGSGANSNNKQTGLKNSLGMTDTTSANGNTDNIVFWGLENWWGNKYEWVDNVVVNSGTWVITEDDGTTRTPTGTMAAAGSWVYPSKFVLNDDLDVIGASGQTGGSDSTGYCDGQYIANQSSRVVARSCSNAAANGGVACVRASLDSSDSSSYYGSRLAFTGTIEIS